MSITYEPIVTASIAKQIAEQIRESIMDGRLKADDRLPTEHELAKQFEVSRPTIREALKRLAAQNLIRSRRGPSGGTFVNRPSEEEVRSNLTTTMTLLISLGEFDLTRSSRRATSSKSCAAGSPRSAMSNAISTPWPPK